MGSQRDAVTADAPESGGGPAALRRNRAGRRSRSSDGQTIKRPDHQGDDQASDLLVRVGMAGFEPTTP